MKCFFLFIFSVLFADIGPRGFLPYKNECFVETGTCHGGSAYTAFRAGFKEIYSIENDPEFFASATEKLKGYRRIKLRFGDSSTDLWEIIKGIDKPITFWLDAHRYP